MIGDALWTRFGRGKENQIWYYNALWDVFMTGPETHPIFNEFLETVDIFNDLVEPD